MASELKIIRTTANPTPDYYCTWQTQLHAAINCQRAGARGFFLKNGKEITVKTDGFKTLLIDLATGEII